MADRIRDISDFIERLEELIERIDSGEVSESKARVILSTRKLELSAATANLQYQRLMKWATGPMPMLPPKAKNGNGKPKNGKTVKTEEPPKDS